MVSRRSLDQTVGMTGDMNGSSSHEATVRPTPSELHKYIKRESNCFHTFIGTSEPDHAREGPMTRCPPIDASVRLVAVVVAIPIPHVATSFDLVIYVGTLVIRLGPLK
jgi:hypothetical protein